MPSQPCMSSHDIREARTILMTDLDTDLSEHRRHGMTRSNPATTRHDQRDLRRTAVNVLLANWTGRSTVPSRKLYPHQWSWDSAFIALGLRHIWPGRAQRELESLFRAQWSDGRLPHIVFNPAVANDRYFPDWTFWSSPALLRKAPAGLRTSGLIQPPIHALAAWAVHQADPELSRRRGFLNWIYPRLARWHRYLRQHRDFAGNGMAGIVHPWESGMDNSACWDVPLSRVTTRDNGFQRRDLRYAATEERPTDIDYLRFAALAADYRDNGYRDDHDHQFVVEDPAFNALLAASEDALGDIARELGGADLAVIHATTAQQLTAAIVDVLWDAERSFFFPRDLRGGGRLAERYGCTGAVPLVLPNLPVATPLLKTLRGPRFQLGKVIGLPSYDLTSSEFEPTRYWRGPSWFNVGWIIHRGLTIHQENQAADELRTSLIHTAHTSDFAEYVDPLSGTAHGTKDFGWTAALTIDLMDQRRST